MNDIPKQGRRLDLEKVSPLFLAQAKNAVRRDFIARTKAKRGAFARSKASRAHIRPRITGITAYGEHLYKVDFAFGGGERSVVCVIGENPDPPPRT